LSLTTGSVIDGKQAINEAWRRDRTLNHAPPIADKSQDYQTNAGKKTILDTSR